MPTRLHHDELAKGKYFVRMSAASFLSTSEPIMRSTSGLSILVERRRFRAIFGVSPLVCSIVWNKLDGSVCRRARPKHLLWALLFLKVYASEHNNRVLVNADEKSFRKWAWRFVKYVANLRIESYVYLFICERIVISS